MEQQNSRQVQTVLGSVEPSSFSFGLAHEHLLYDLSLGARSPLEFARKFATMATNVDEYGYVTTASALHRWEQPIGTHNFNDVRRNFGAYRAAVRQVDADFARAEVELFARAGGDLIVDATPSGLARDPEGLAQISRSSGVAIVMSTGYYTRHAHPSDVEDAPIAALVQRMTSEITDGVAWGSRVRAGVIKIALDATAHPLEEKTLRAAAIVQRELGVPMIIHPGKVDGPLRALDILESAGGLAERTTIAHVGEGAGIDDVLRIADRGAYLGVDQFGKDGTHRRRTAAPMSNDVDRIELIASLCEAGHADRILVSCDAAQGWMFAQNGGEGLALIPAHIAPLMRTLGIDAAQVTRFFRENLRQFLAF